MLHLSLAVQDTAGLFSTVPTTVRLWETFILTGEASLPVSFLPPLSMGSAFLCPCHGDNVQGCIHMYVIMYVHTLRYWHYFSF